MTVQYSNNRQKRACITLHLHQIEMDNGSRNAIQQQYRMKICLEELTTMQLRNGSIKGTHTPLEPSSQTLCYTFYTSLLMKSLLTVIIIIISLHITYWLISIKPTNRKSMSALAPPIGNDHIACQTSLYANQILSNTKPTNRKNAK